MQLLLLLVLESFCNNSDSIVANRIAAKIELADRLAVLQNVLQLIKTIKANVVLLKCEHFKIALFSKGATQSQRSFREDTIARQPYLRDILCVLKNFGYMPGAIWSNKVV